MGSVTTTASLCFHGNMFVNKGACFFRMTLDADCIAARHCPYLAQGRGAMYVVAIAASDEPFIDSMVIRLRKIRLG